MASALIDTLRRRLSAHAYDQCFEIFRAVKARPEEDVAFRSHCATQLLLIASVDAEAYESLRAYLMQTEPHLLLANNVKTT